MSGPLRVVFLGLSITSSWGNGHATTYRGLVKGLAQAGHDVLFLERDVPWYAQHRDLRSFAFGRIALYSGLPELRDRFAADVRDADCVIVGSYVPDGVAVGDWVLDAARGVTAFYDIDTPVTLAALSHGEAAYLHPRQIPRYRLYLSFTGGPTLQLLERQFGSPCARPLYCSADPDLYHPHEELPHWDLGYLGTYSQDRQPALSSLLLEVAQRCPERRFVVAGPQYPKDLRWPPNVDRLEHVSPAEHRAFYNGQRFTLNITRADMVRAGYSPSVRLFEAAACGVPVISDPWEGLSAFFLPGEEILVAHGTEDVLRYLTLLRDPDRAALAERARTRFLKQHTSAHRAEELLRYVSECRAQKEQGKERGQ